MSKSKGTKRSLLASLTSLLLCVAMLIGSTFAWFTDTASTAVNKIQAGNLDVELYYGDNATGGDGTSWTKFADNSGALGWVQAKASDGTTTEIVSTEGLPLWEPGCTFSLPALKIVNEGDLALKYKIVISGITGSAKLLDVIDWTMKVDGKDETLGTEHTLAAKAADAEETDTNYDIFTISGHMKEEAGNEYQGLSIDGIGITVYATQVEGEYDSSTDDYDADAKYDIQITETATGNLPVTTETGAGDTKTVEVSNTTTISSGSVSVEYPVGVVLSSNTETTGDTNEKATVEQKMEYTGAALSRAATEKSIKIDSSEQAVASYELTLPVAETNTILVPVTLQYEKGLTGVKVYHSGEELSGTAADPGDSAREYFTYDAQTGLLTLHLLHASPIDIVFKKTNTVTVTTADELKAALDDASVKTIKLGNDMELNTVLDVTHSVTIDFCGKTINAKPCHDNYVFCVEANNKLTFKDSSSTAGTFESTYGGVDLCGDNAQFELNNVTMECAGKFAIHVKETGVLKNTSIVMNSGKIDVPSGNGALKSGCTNEAGTGHTITINGGEIVCGGINQGIYVNHNCTLTMTNCTFSKVGNKPFIFAYDWTDNDNNTHKGIMNCSVTIKNLTFTGTDNLIDENELFEIDDVFMNYVDAGNPALTIEDSTFTINDRSVDIKNLLDPSI